MNEQRIEIAFVTPLQIVSTPPPIRVRLTTTYAGFVITTEGDKAMYTLPADHYVKMQVAYVDAAGNPATVDGPVVWQASDEGIVRVSTDADDSTICTVEPLGPLGQVQVIATADADLGTGRRALITTIDIDIVSGEAVAGTIAPVGESVPLPQ